MKRYLFLALFLVSCGHKAPAPVTLEILQQQDEQSKLQFKSATIETSNPGISALGGANYCAELRAELPRGWDVAFDTIALKDAIPCMKQICDDGKAASILGHLKWEDSHACTRDLAGVEKEASRLNAVAAYCAKKNIPVFVSGQCEHNCDENGAKLLRAKSLAKCPLCAGYVNTPLNGAFLYDGNTINETHGQTPRKPTKGLWWVDWDGTPAVDGNVEAWKQWTATAQKRRYWDACNNGKFEASDTTPRDQRKGWCTREQLRAEVRLNSPRGAVGLLPPLWLYKSSSENKGTTDPRAERPAIIIPIKTESVSLVTTNGKEIIKCPGGTKWSPMTTAPWSAQHPGFRNYCPLEGYKLADKARQLSGSELTFIHVNGKNYGPINPAFREGFSH